MQSVVGPKPKKALSAYFLFNIQHTAELRAKQPDLSITEISKKAGEAWKKLSDAQK